MTQARAGNISAAELEKYITGVHFPADKDTIIGHAQHKGAPPKIVVFINHAPKRTYEGIADLSVGMTLGRHQ